MDLAAQLAAAQAALTEALSARAEAEKLFSTEKARYIS